MSEWFDPWDPAFLIDPFPTYQRLRDEEPCVRLAFDSAEVWAVSRFDDVRDVTRDYKRYSAATGDGIRPMNGGGLLPASDPPAHSGTRRVLQPMFLMRVLGHWEEEAERIARRRLADLLRVGSFDFKNDFAMPLALDIITQMMGIPDDEESRAKYQRWSRSLMDALGAREGDPAVERVTESIAEGVHFFEEVIEQRQRGECGESPDILDALIEGTSAMHTRPEVARIALTLMSAGNQNTTDTMCHAVVEFARHRDQWDQFRGDLGLAKNVFHEALRVGTPAQAIFRLVRHDIELHGHVVHAGNRIMALFGSANMDERRYERPQEFDIRRGRSDHLGFGVGVHKCLGEPVAEIEGAVALKVFADMVSSYDVEPLDVNNTPMIRGFETLPVDVDAAP